jgi:hypothetical protein
MFHEDLYLALRSLEFLPAGIGKAYSFFEQLDGLLQGKVPTFKLLDDFFELLQAIFEFRQ